MSQLSQQRLWSRQPRVCRHHHGHRCHLLLCHARLHHPHAHLQFQLLMVGSQHPHCRLAPNLLSPQARLVCHWLTVRHGCSFRAH